MHRRARFLPALLLLVGLACGALVARVPQDLERTVVTPLHHGADPLLSAVLLRFGVTSLVTSPARYFSPPILHPDPNPLRGTEPLLAEALLAVPVRLAFGDRPAPVFTVVRIVTLALLALATGLMLRELGARDSLCLAGGSLAVLVSTTAIFVDRIQAVSLQWLPLAILLAVRYWRTGRALLLLPLALCAFLFVQASLYSTVMLVGALPFLVPLAVVLARREPGPRRAAGLAAGLAAAGLLSLAVLWPYLRDRADVAAYASPAYAPEKSWNPAFAREALVSPPEFGPESWPLRPHASWNGFFPGHASLLLALAVGVLAWLPSRGGPEPPAAPASRAFRISRWALLGCATGLAANLALSSRSEPTAATRLAADVLLWGTLLAWSLRLALWPPGDDATRALARAASGFGLAAAVCFVLAHGSPIRLHHEAAPVATGLFAPLSSLIAPLRELRELRRYLLPAGWAAVAAVTLALEGRLAGRPRAIGPLLAAAVVGVGMGERLVADTRKAFVPPPPPAYELLRESRGRGGLLELPVDTWAQITSIHRMLWQPSHGRPILAGRTGLDPSWYQPARAVFNEFPSRESLRLARAWGLDTVLDRRPVEVERAAAHDSLVLRGERVEDGRLGHWRLFDVAPASAEPALGPEPQPPPGTWQRPAWATIGARAAESAIDGSLDTAAEVADPDGLSLVVPESEALAAVELDYGLGRFSRIPPDLRVLGLRDGVWVEMAEDQSRLELRARAANLLMRERRARLVVTLQAGRARRLRLVSSRLPWEIPEVRVLVAPAPGATAPLP